MRAVLSMGLLVAITACAPKESAPDFPIASPGEVWTALQPAAERYRFEPAFIYALVAAESNFNARAGNGVARGLLQIKPTAWRTVSNLPYEPNVWNWRINLEVGIDYLAYSRNYLHQKTAFSYPLLLAAFHYGLDAVERRGFDPQRFTVPDNPIYRELWQGNLRPVARPTDAKSSPGFGASLMQIESTADRANPL